MKFLGIDTSCYTTSVAVVDQNGKILFDERNVLKTKNGARGLRQSDGFYQHIMNLPEIIKLIPETMMRELVSISVTSVPRDVEGSYMPVFNSGVKFAETLGHALSVPVLAFSHQAGHIMASMMGTDCDVNKPFLSVHLSGGTSEILLSRWNGISFDSDIVGGTKDISAGQLIDRVGVAFGLDFPAGKEMEKLSLESSKALRFPVSVKDGYFNLSGAESYASKYLSLGEAPSDIAMGTIKVVSDSLAAALEQVVEKVEVKDVLLAGGVASNQFISGHLTERLSQRGITISRGQQNLCTDNAVGIALLGMKQWR